MEHWLRDAAAPKVSPRTLEGYRIMLEKHVLPVLGSQRLAQVTTLDVQNLINGMSKRGLSPRSLQMTHRILNQELKLAVTRGEPCSGRRAAKAAAAREASVLDR